MFQIQCRYQRYTSSGIGWTKWFNFYECSSEEEAKEIISHLPKVERGNKKLKREYQIVSCY